MAQISANRGDIAEGIMGAALTAKFIKRKLKIYCHYLNLQKKP